MCKTWCASHVPQGGSGPRLRQRDALTPPGYLGTKNDAGQRVAGVPGGSTLGLCGRAGR